MAAGKCGSSGFTSVIVAVEERSAISCAVRVVEVVWSTSVARAVVEAEGAFLARFAEPLVLAFAAVAVVVDVAGDVTRVVGAVVDVGAFQVTKWSDFVL